MTKRDDDKVLVCALLTTPLYLPDNRIGRCSECKRKVQFRPNVERMRRLCMDCASDAMDADTVVEVPQRVVDELNEYRRKRQH